MTRDYKNLQSMSIGVPAGVTHSCGCIGPQNGEPLCPCRMRGVEVKDGRYVQTIDYGPVRNDPHGAGLRGAAAYAGQKLKAGVRIPERPKVKPLVWTKDGSIGDLGGWRGVIGNETRIVKVGWVDIKPYEFGGEPFATLKEAQAAAQADVEACVASMLEDW